MALGEQTERLGGVPERPDRERKGTPPRSGARRGLGLPTPGAGADRELIRRASRELAPRSVGALLDDAVDVLRADFPALVGMSFVVWLPIAAIQHLLLSGATETIDPSVEMFLAVFVLFGANFASVLVSAGCALVTFGAVGGQRVSFGAALKRFVVYLPALVVAGLALGLASFLGFFTCGVLTILFWWRWQFAYAVIVVEGAGPIEGLRRSWRLTGRGFLRWLGVFFSAFFFVFPFSGASAAFDQGFAAEQFKDWFPGLDSVALGGLSIAMNAVVKAVPGAFVGVVASLFYVDLRVRREGLDLGLGLDAVENLEKRT